MGHNDHAAAVPRQLAEEGGDAAAVLSVQIAGGLIRQQEPRPAGKCPGNGRPLLLPAGELRREPPLLFRRDPDLPQKRPGRLLRVPPPPALELPGNADVLQHRQKGEELEGLKDHGYPLPAVAVRIHSSDLLPVQEDASLRGPVQTGQQGEERALPAAGGTDDRRHLPGEKFSAEVPQHRAPAAGILIAHMLDRQLFHLRFLPFIPWSAAAQGGPSAGWQRRLPRCLSGSLE